MKNVLLSIIAVFVFMTTINASNIHDPSVLKAQKAKITKEVKLKIDYPLFAIENDIQGTVYISFWLNNKGEIIVKRISSSQPSLEEYVLEELSKLKIEQDVEYFNVDYSVKLSFKLQ